MSAPGVNMAHYRLSAAERPDVKAISDLLAARYSIQADEPTVYALANLFLMIAGAARDAGAITDKQLAHIRSEIGAQLHPRTETSRYTPLEQTVLRAIGGYEHPVTQALLCGSQGLPPESISCVVKSLRVKGAVSLKMHGKVGGYVLTDIAAEFRATSPRGILPAGALIRTPVPETRKRAQRAPSLLKKVR
jgi:hypothetical protein